MIQSFQCCAALVLCPGMPQCGAKGGTSVKGILVPAVTKCQKDRSPSSGTVAIFSPFFEEIQGKYKAVLDDSKCPVYLFSTTVHFRAHPTAASHRSPQTHQTKLVHMRSGFSRDSAQRNLTTTAGAGQGAMGASDGQSHRSLSLICRRPGTECSRRRAPTPREGPDHRSDVGNPQHAVRNHKFVFTNGITEAP